MMLNNVNRPLVLVIAGLDSGGGAGVTADCLTIYDHGAFPLPTVTALTVQSLKQVAAVENTNDELFVKTLKTAIDDWPQISAVKVGLICKQSHLDLLLKLFNDKFKAIPIVWDPVLTATAGRLDSADLKANLKSILQVCTIFTPNLPEALELASWTPQMLKERGVRALCQYFLDLGAKNVIIKGGHLDDVTEACDVFASNTLSFSMSYAKKVGDGAHGGGCALSSALAALLAKSYAPFDAAVIAKAYVTSGIYNPALKVNEYRPPIGHNGFIYDLDYYPQVFEDKFPNKVYNFDKTVIDMGLYPVVPDNEWLEKLLKLGIRTIQLRIKNKADPMLFEKIQKAVKLGLQYKARVFIDDHYELAIKAHAYGVHLGMEDLITADLDSIKAAGLKLGISTHGPYEMLKAYQIRPSYIALGHIFPTNSKVMPSKPQGVEKLSKEVKILRGKIPLVAIGGIKFDSLEAIKNTNVGSVAVITALTDIKDDEFLAKTVKQWLDVIGNGGDEQ